MAIAGCYGARNLVAIRASRVEADGTRICPNLDGSAEMTGGAISFSAQLRIDQGQTDVQRDGDGNVCNTRTSADVITGVDLSLELCIFDFEMIETLTGGVIAVDAGTTYGWEYARATDITPHVEFHAWARTWDGAGQAAAPYSYTQLGFFNTTWVPGQLQVQENALSFPLSGKGSENANISIGSFDDIPPEFVGSFGGAWFVPTANVPTTDCGYVDTPACGVS